jgi:peptidyl-prolyl cis-trans isomerase C
MKFYGKFKYLQLVAAVSLMVFQAGQAVGEEAKTPQPKQEAVTKSTDAAKPDASAKPVTAAKPDAVAKTSPDDTIVKVNGTIITRAEMDRAMKVLSAQSQMGKQTPPSKSAEDTVLEQLISAELLFQAGTKLGVKDLDKQVADKVAQGKAKFKTDAEYENALKSAGLTPKALEELLRKDIVINNLVVKEIVPKVTVSDTDAKKFYDENIDKFKRPEQIKASHILCKVDPKASAEDKKKAKEKAASLLKEIKSGKEFTELAKTNSDCPSSKQGGDLGLFGKGQMVPAFESAAFALKPGEVSDVVETQFGYHIIKVTEKKDAGSAKFDEVKDRIQEYLKNQKIQKGVLDYITQLKEKAKIEKITN